MSYFDGAQAIFDDRYKEIQKFIALAKDLALQEQLLKSNGIEFNRNHEHSLKSNIILMQYNLLESVFVEIYKEFYSVLMDCNKSLDTLPIKFAYNFFLLVRRMPSKNGQEFHKKLMDSNNGFNFSKSLIQASFTLTEEERKFLVNGNLDSKKIKEFMTDWGIDLSNIDESIISPLKTLKDQRQLLAHGGLSFAEVGKELTWDNIDEYNSALNYIFTESKILLANHIQNLI